MADMIYNGVELPDIDTAWTNQDKYPYAAITYSYSSDGLYELWLSSAPFLVRTYSGSEAISLVAPESYNVDYQRWWVLIGDWTLMDSSTVWANNTLNGEGNLVYATYDVYDTADNLYLAGSTPTGGSGGDGGDTGGGGDGDDTHTHSFIPTTIDPTCTESGYVIYECDCGSSYRGDDIPATGHQWDGNTCTVCGVTRTVRHSNVIDFFAGLMMGQKIKKIKNGVAKATMYLYGTPSETGNIGLRSGGVVTYYDGVVAPELPEWDKTAYPYVALNYARSMVMSLRRLYFSTEPCYRLESQGTDAPHTWFIPVPCMVSSLISETEWGEPTLSTATEDMTIVLARWANHDVYNADGSLCFQSSDPIPVGEIVDYEGDIPIYEVI